MLKQVLRLIISLFLTVIAVTDCGAHQNIPDNINDGPYIFNINNKFVAKWIESSVLIVHKVKPDKFDSFKAKFNLLFDYSDLTDTYLLRPQYNQRFTDIDSIAVISDIHGEYDTYISMLKAQRIIDKNLNWIFGKGHLVILGDSFDRGDKVTELLWHIFGLEKQAAKAGGMVHIIMGNHEAMMLSKDIRYINPKYIGVESITETKYYDLFSPESVLGKWLRFCPVIISINDIIFVHGGISIEMVRRNLRIPQINRFFSNMILGTDLPTETDIEEMTFLNDDFGPIWYRGYFTNTDFCELKIDSILNFYDKKHVVVGHTSQDQINSLFNNKVFGIDAGIMNDKAGQMLIYKNGLFYCGLPSGKREKFN
jgi:hypothetical protein